MSDLPRSATQALPLIDPKTCQMLQTAFSAEELGELTAFGMAKMAEYVQALSLAGATAAVRIREAHKIKGSAGTLGLRRLGAIADGVEQGSAAGHDVEEMVTDLVEALAATHRALLAQGLLPQSPKLTAA